MKKFIAILQTIFANGILACLFAGGLSLLGYLAGLIIGGEAAAALCAWVFKTWLPWVIKATSVFTGIGLLAMYLNRETALTAEIGKKDPE